MMSHLTDNRRPDYDPEIQQIADYVCHATIDSHLAYDTARLCLMDSLACALLALSYPACTQLVGPIVPNAVLTNGARVPGTSLVLDPVQAAFNIGLLIRWLDYNDTWLAQEWAHPSDNLGGLLAVTDYRDRNPSLFQQPPLLMRDLFTAMIKAHEIQGVLAIANGFNRVGLDHVVYVKVATTAVVTQLLGGDYQQVCAAISQAFVDGQSLRTYRHSPNTGARKSWAAGDATARGVYLALLTLKGEKGYPSVLTAKGWGLYDVYFKGQPFKFPRTYGSYVMENILFKISYPAEFHAQTAVECAIALHPKVKQRLEDIDRIVIRTQEPAMRILNKTGPLYNPADRDHCLQYIVAIGLIYGELTADHYEDTTAADPRIDRLREKMTLQEEAQFTKDYFDPDKRFIGNAIQVFFKDGSATEEILVDFPVGHRQRRPEGIPLLKKKYHNSVLAHFPEEQADRLLVLYEEPHLLTMPISDFMSLWAIKPSA